MTHKADPRSFPEWGTLPCGDDQKLLDVLEDKADVAAIAEMRERLRRGDEELIPVEVVERLLTENPYRVWREYRGLSQQDVADAAKVSRAYISQLENGERSNPSPGVVDVIARKLAVDVDDLE